MTPWVVVLAGGVGSRFWPLSTPTRPKQLLPLVTERPLLADAVERLRPLAGLEHTLILANATLVPQIAAMLPDMPITNLVAEPRAGGTAAALAWAAREIERRAGSDAVMISVHADWAIGDDEGFRHTLTRAVSVARERRALVNVGVVPTRPDPGFGYIQPGEELESGVWQVERFVEKPDRARAERMCADGFLWNSGIFVWRTGDFLDDVRRLAPEVAPALQAHENDLAAFFTAVTPISVDVGVLERSDRVVVMRGEFGWDDVGTWGALRRVRRADEHGNAMTGTAYAIDADGNVVHAEDRTVVLYGVANLVVVARGDVILVTTVDRSSDLKTLIDRLPSAVRDQT
jgi:mannose-1-phosphate guanylyltransferase